MSLFSYEQETFFRTLTTKATSFVLLSSMFVLCFCLPFLTVGSVSAEPLKANIQFDHELEPLESGLREGQKLNLGAERMNGTFDRLNGSAGQMNGNAGVMNGGVESMNSILDRLNARLDNMKAGADHTELGGRADNLKLGGSTTRKRITDWRRVPNWFAGTWHKENSTRWVDGRPISYQTRADLITGYQQDSKGRIWQPVFANVGKVETDDYVEYQIPQRKTVYAIEDQKYTSFSLSSRVRVDKDTNQIMSSFQQEDLSTSTPMRDGNVKAVVQCRVFNQDGRLKFEDTIEVLEEKTEDFNPIDEFDGIDFRQSFADFLEEKGHPELIPPPRAKSILTQSQERILSNEAKVNRMHGR